MLPIYRILRVGLALLAAAVVFPVVGEWFIDLAKEKGFYEHPSERLGLAMSWLQFIADLPGLKLGAGFLVGLSVGIWFDTLLRKRTQPAAKPLASSPIWPSSPYTYTHVRVQFKGGGIAPVIVDETNVFRWYALGALLVPADPRLPPTMKIAGWTFHMVFDRPIIYRQIKVDGLGLLRYEVKDYSQRHAIVGILGDPPASVVDFIAME